jgi:hypothetical protein
VELKRVETQAPVAVALLAREPFAAALIPMATNATASTPTSQPVSRIA